MGEYADDAIERMIDFPRYRKYKRAPKFATFAQLGRVTWTTKDRQVLTVAEMDNDHRKNALNLLYRQNSKQVVDRSNIGRALKAYIERDNNG